MNQKRVLAVHDISCVGKCSLTVALPIVSSVGIECSVLPTAVLSTHTGGFTGFTYRDLTEDIVPVEDHWGSLGLGFDAIYTGFLGSFEQIDLVMDLIDRFKGRGTTVYVDPAMADKGQLYSVFGPDFPKGMRRLCEKADVIKPNMTELTMMLGMEYTDGPYTREYIDSILDAASAFGTRRIVVTGISFEPGRIGAIYRDYSTGETGEVMRDEVPGYYHGTGDIFGSALVAACESGLPLRDAVEAAVDLTVGSIIRTYRAGTDVRFGVDFEHGLREFSTRVVSLSPGVRLRRATKGDDLRLISSLANEIWFEAYRGMESDEQLRYMLDKYLSIPAMEEQLSAGYEYYIAEAEGHAVGFTGFHPEEDAMFLSKLYVLKEYRGRGISHDMLDLVVTRTKDKGLKSIYLTVNRHNTSAVAVYEKMGFKAEKDVDTDIGGGFYMKDHIMRLIV
jgi:pyridoxine kinase